MLAVKNVLSAQDAVSMVFDEVDTGVSGVAAQRVGEKLAQLSRGRQILCVTHLPQLAALADSHLLITKQVRDGRTYTEITPLDREARKRELSRLISGENVTTVSLAAAEELIAGGERFKEKLEARP